MASVVLVSDRMHLVAISIKEVFLCSIRWQCDLSVGKGKKGLGKRDKMASFFNRKSSAGTVDCDIENKISHRLHMRGLRLPIGYFPVRVLPDFQVGRCQAEWLSSGYFLEK